MRNSFNHRSSALSKAELRDDSLGVREGRSGYARQAVFLFLVPLRYPYSLPRLSPVAPSNAKARGVLDVDLLLGRLASIGGYLVPAGGEDQANVAGHVQRTAAIESTEWRDLAGPGLAGVDQSLDLEGLHTGFATIAGGNDKVVEEGLPIGGGADAVIAGGQADLDICFTLVDDGEHRQLVVAWRRCHEHAG